MVVLLCPITVYGNNLSEFKDTKTSGFIEVVKSWVSNELGKLSDLPKISIGSSKPSKDARGYTVTYHGNGGMFSNGSDVNEVLYTASSTILSGDYIIPYDEYRPSFIGWYCDDACTLKMDGVHEDGTFDVTLTQDLDLYAGYGGYMPKYSVSVYDIERDVGHDGSKLGITFGPSFGKDYSMSYKDHNPSDETDKGNDYRCIHSDTWDTIVHWNDIDPYVYEQCIKEGCTHSIVLDLSKADFTDKTYNNYYVGDGVSCLWALEIGTWQVNTKYGVAPWSKSRLRAMLNGFDEYTVLGEDSRVGYGNTYTDISDGFNESNNLFLTLPQVLQDAIEPRLTVGEEYSVYDKLWILSKAEVTPGSSAYSRCSYFEKETGYVSQKISSSNAIEARAYSSRYMRDTTSGYFTYVIMNSSCQFSSTTGGEYPVYFCFALR